MRVGRSVAAVSALLATACGSLTAQSVAPSATVSHGPLPGGVFVAKYEHGSGDTGGGHGTFLALFDEQSGKHVRDLVHVREGSQVVPAGFSRSADGSITYAMARGPYYQSNAMGGDPRPGSCGGNVYRLDARTGRATLLFSVDKDRTVRAPEVSPDGKSVAYLSQACTAMFAARVVVRDLASGTERQVSVARASITWVHWSGDGAHLVFTLMYPEQRSRSDVSSYAVVPAGMVGELPAAEVRHAPDSGCVVENAIFSTVGVQVVEACPDLVTMPARLVQLAGDGPGITWRANTHLCPNGMTVAHDPQGRLLVTSTNGCIAGRAPSVNVVQMWTSRQSGEVGRYVNPQQFVNEAA